MKKYLYIFSVMLFFIFVPNVRAEEYKMCMYQINGYRALLYEKNGRPVIEIYKNNVVFDDFHETRTNIINGGTIDTSDLLGVNTNKNQPMDIKFLTIRCPKAMCAEGTSADDKVWVDESGSCKLLQHTYKFLREWTKNQASNLNEALKFQYGAADPSKVNYTSILSGSCPSDVAAFKLLGSAYSLLKIIAPLALVVFASIDLAKAVIAADESGIKKAQKHCLKRFAAAIIVLLSFVIVEMIINMASSGSEIMSCVNELLK